MRKTLLALALALAVLLVCAPDTAARDRSWWPYTSTGEYRVPRPCRHPGYRCDWNGGGCKRWRPNNTKACWYPPTKTMWVVDGRPDGFGAGAVYKITNPNGRQGVCWDNHGSGVWSRCHFAWARSGHHRMWMKAGACKPNGTSLCRNGGYSAWGNSNRELRGPMRIGRF